MVLFVAHDSITNIRRRDKIKKTINAGKFAIAWHHTIVKEMSELCKADVSCGVP